MSTEPTTATSSTTSTPAPVKAPLSLASVLGKTVSPDAWIEYKEGIKFHLRYMSKAKFRQLAEDCTEHRYNPQKQVREPKMNVEKFLQKFVADTILDWKGVTLRSLSRLVEIDVSGYTKDEMAQEISFSSAEAIRLMEMVYELDPFIQSCVTDIKTFRPALEDELKN